MQERLFDTLTIRCLRELSEVSELICFLASDGSHYVTGTISDVHGGNLATWLPNWHTRSRGCAGD